MTDVIRFNFNGTPIRDDGEFLCLTDMWRAAGAAENRRPAKWLSQEGTTQFSEYLSDVLLKDIALFRSEKGGLGGSGTTWAHWQLAMAYAKYLSPAFHAWCNDVVRRVMGGGPAAAPTSAQLLELIAQIITPIVASLQSSVSQALDLASQALAFANDTSRRLDNIEKYVATGGEIPAPRFRELQALVREIGLAMVAAGIRKSPAAARSAIYRRLGVELGWGGGGQKWAAMPAQLEPAARAILNRIRKDLPTPARKGSNSRQLTLIKTL